MKLDLEVLTFDEAFKLRAAVQVVLAKKLVAERAAIDERLRRLQPADATRRPYPPVKPKFQNPDQPSETWSGRGKRPRWLDAKLRSGGHLDDFRIAS